VSVVAGILLWSLLVGVCRSENALILVPDSTGFVQVGQSGGSESSGGLRSESSKPPWSTDVAENDWKYIVLHHSGTAAGSVEAIHREHRSRRDASGNNWLGIGYHFVIGNGNGMTDGSVVGTFRWKDQIHGAHSGHAVFNARGIGICLIGNFEERAPTAKQMAAVRKLVGMLAGRFSISGDRVVGHSSIRATSCPGKLFPLKELREIASKEAMVLTQPAF